MGNKLHKLHPISCLKLEDINKEYLMNNLPRHLLIVLNYIQH